MKPGTKLLSHEGHEWRVARQDPHNAEKVVIQTHDGNRFIAHKSLIHHHAKRLTILRRLIRWIKGVLK